MAEGGSRRIDENRWRAKIVEHLEDFPRQYAALENAMAAFDGDFDLHRFKEAFNTTEDLDAYNDVQAVERALSRVQNYTAELAINGAKLARLALTAMAEDDSPALQAFTGLRDVQVISASLCRQLTRAQRARTRIEHHYVRAPAGDVHRAAELVHETALDFIAAYRDWIEGYLIDPS